MQRKPLNCSLAILGLVWLLATLVGGAAEAYASDRYFVEFRARSSTYIGHNYIVYYRTDADGKALERQYAGLIPQDDGWKGLFAPIRASITKYKDDTRLPPTAIYRREVTASQYHTVKRAVRILKNYAREWHVIFFNCNDFAIEIAEILGLRRPPSLMAPDFWVMGLRALNER